MADGRTVSDRDPIGGRSTTAAPDPARTVPTGGGAGDRSGPGRSVVDDAPVTPGVAPVITPGAGLPAPSAPGAPGGTQNAPTDGQAIAGSRFGGGMFGTLADVLMDLLGPDDSGAPQAPVVVGDAGYTSSGGGSNGLLIVLILGGVGAAFYFLIYKKGVLGGH